MTPEAVAALKLNIESLESQLSTLKANEKKARAALAALHAKPRAYALREDISRLQAEEAKIQARLASHHETGSDQMSAAERVQLEEEWKRWQRHVHVRRRICRELWGQCSEVLPEGVTKSDLWVSSKSNK